MQVTVSYILELITAVMEWHDSTRGHLVDSIGPWSGLKRVVGCVVRLPELCDLFRPRPAVPGPTAADDAEQ